MVLLKQRHFSSWFASADVLSKKEKNVAGNVIVLFACPLGLTRLKYP
jgi:hypothetical protein